MDYFCNGNSSSQNTWWVYLWPRRALRYTFFTTTALACKPVLPSKEILPMETIHKDRSPSTSPHQHTIASSDMKTNERAI
jgi:hypothetical protein